MHQFLEAVDRFRLASIQFPVENQSNRFTSTFSKPPTPQQSIRVNPRTKLASCHQSTSEGRTLASKVVRFKAQVEARSKPNLWNDEDALRNSQRHRWSRRRSNKRFVLHFLHRTFELSLASDQLTWQTTNAWGSAKANKITHRHYNLKEP